MVLSQNYSPSPLEIGSISLHCDPTGGPTTSFRLTRHAGQSGHLVLGMGNLWQFTMILWQVEKIGNDESLHFFFKLWYPVFGDMQISKVWKNPDFKVWTQPKVDCLLLPMCWKVPAEIPAETQFLVTSPAYIISHRGLIDRLLWGRMCCDDFVAIY